MPRTPSFWYRPKPGLVALALLPVTAIYRAIAKNRRGHAVKLPCPLIAIGNVTAGGSGKTPLAIALRNLVAQAYPDKRIWFLSRGTGGKIKGPVLVPADGDAADYGDEPLLLAKHASTFISRNRGAGAQLAAEQGAELIVMDDGLQNPTVKPDLSLVIVDGEKGFGNGLTIPSGPLREPLKPRLEKADAVIIVDADTSNIRSQLPDGITVLQAWRRPIMPLPDNTQTYIFFSGIAHPQRALRTARDAGLKIIDFRPYPDHYAYSTKDMADLVVAAATRQAKLLTTEKDMARLPADFPASVLKIKVEFDAPAAVLQLVSRVLGR
jgi:tetraacyldisaccharide 4'-kinase